MPGLEEGVTVWRFRIHDPDKFDKFRVDDFKRNEKVVKGVRVVKGRIKGTDRWDIQSFMFDKKVFKTREQVLEWIEKNVKPEAKTLLDYKAFNEARMQLLRVWLEISRVSA